MDSRSTLRLRRADAFGSNGILRAAIPGGLSRSFTPGSRSLSRSPSAHRRALMRACYVHRRQRESDAMRKILIIGIGAGDPEYVTVQAINALNRVDAFFIPNKGEEK
jgi:hypothetical protein